MIFPQFCGFQGDSAVTFHENNKWGKSIVFNARPTPFLQKFPLSPATFEKFSNKTEFAGNSIQNFPEATLKSSKNC